MLAYLTEVVGCEKSIINLQRKFNLQPRFLEKTYSIYRNTIDFRSLNIKLSNMYNKIPHSLLIVFISFFGSPILSIAGECGEAIKPVSYYNNISLYSLIAGFGLVFIGIISDVKLIKNTSFVCAFLPFVLWTYVHFMVDFTELKKNVFAYNALAEGTLANIAEAQDRYKSEQDIFLKDLQQLYSHTAGSQGINPCVRILKITAGFKHWAAEAKHISSPDTIRWDSNIGSSLKKG